MPDYTDAELVTHLRELADDLGTTPTQRGMDAAAGPCAATYHNRFGSWNAALDAAGLAVNKPTEHVGNGTWAQVAVECAVCGESFTVRQSKFDSQDQFCCSRECEYRRRSEVYSGTGNPRSTLKEVECDVCGETFLRARWAREQNDRTYCSDCWGNAYVTVECEWCGQEKQVWPSHRDQAQIHFCDNTCHGKWLSENNVGPAHPRWRHGGPPNYYGPNWIAKRAATRRRDQYRCQLCGLTEPESYERFGEQLHAHHITPIREFQTAGVFDYEAANDLENLITLCRSCHMSVESESSNVEVTT